MDKFIIGVSYIVVIYFFYCLIKTRLKNKKNTPNKIYVLIVLIFVLFIIWSIFRNF